VEGVDEPNYSAEAVMVVGSVKSTGSFQEVAGYIHDSEHDASSALRGSDGDDERGGGC
jgi:hypothetical protein